MRNIPQNLQDSLSSEVSTICHMCLITLQGGNKLAFTSLDEDIEFEGETYLSNPGFFVEDYNNSQELKSDEFEVIGLFEDESITQEDIKKGLLDDAKVEIFLIDYESSTGDKAVLQKGFISKVISQDGESFRAEISSFADKLNKNITDVYSPQCRAKLGDAKCGVDLQALTFSGSVSSADSDVRFADSTLTQTDGYFNYGIIKFTSGKNQGYSMEVKNFLRGLIELILPLPEAPEIGDEFTISAGCDKQFSTCVSKFNNAANFRGEPHVPGTDKILRGG